MKLFIPQIDDTIICDKKICPSLVIEKPNVWCSILQDITEQLQGEEGKVVLSNEDKVIPIAKNLEVISQFIPFEINQKGLVSKIMNEMQKLAVNEGHFVQTTTLLAEWERFLLELSTELTGNFNFSKINIESLIKASGLELDNAYDNLGERILDYFELVRVYDREKLFILVNLRSYLSEQDMIEFLKNVSARGYEVLLMDAVDYPRIMGEQRHIVDADQCILC